MACERSQVPVVEDGASPSLLLLDLVELLERDPPGDGGNTGVAPQLLPDAAAPERLFARTAAAAWAVTITWLPALANFLAEGLPLETI